MGQIFKTYWINRHSRQVQFDIGNHFGWSLVKFDRWSLTTCSNTREKVQIWKTLREVTMDRETLWAGDHCRQVLLYITMLLDMMPCRSLSCPTWHIYLYNLISVSYQWQILPQLSYLKNDTDCQYIDLSNYIWVGVPC